MIVQDPQPAVGPPPEFMDRLSRLVKARADVLRTPRFDDRGRVVVPPLSEENATKSAIEYLGRYAQEDGAGERLLNYFDGPAGSPLPENYVPDWSPLKSRETQELELRLAAGRAAHPGIAAARDVADVLAAPGIAVAQAATDLAVGAVNKLGAKHDPIDIRAQAHQLFQALPGVHAAQDAIARSAGVSPDQIVRVPEATAAEIMHRGGRSEEERNIETQRILAAGDAAKSGPAGFAQGTGKLVGEFAGFGQLGKALWVGKGAGNLAKTIAGGTGKAASVAEGVAHGAATLGAIKAIESKEGEALKEAGWGALEGAGLGLASTFAKFAYRGLLRSNVETLGTAEKSASKALYEWADQNKLRPLKGESIDAYGRRVVDTWVDAGMPGGSKIPMRRLMAHAAQGGIESLGMSAIDQEFHKELLEAASSGDLEKWGKVGKKVAANAIASMALHMPLADIPRAQRRGQIEPTGQEPKPQPSVPRETPPQEPATPESKPPEMPRGGGLEAGSFGLEGKPEQVIDMGTMKPAKPRFIQDPILGKYEIKEPIPYDLSLMGWRTFEPTTDLNAPKPPSAADARALEAAGQGAPKPGSVIELPGTSHSYEVDGDMAKPSQSLRDAMGLPETLPVADLHPLLVKAGLVSSLMSKDLPGVEIGVDGTHAVAGSGDTPGYMVRIALGELQKSPLGPEPQWRPAKAGEVPARGKDALDPVQAHAVEALREVLNERDDMDRGDLATLSQVADTLDTVAARNDPSVAETLQALPEILPALAQTPPEQAGKLVQVLAESLTTKTPDKAIEDLGKAQEAKRQEAAAAPEFALTRSKEGGPQAYIGAKTYASREEAAKEGERIGARVVEVPKRQPDSRESEKGSAPLGPESIRAGVKGATNLVGRALGVVFDNPVTRAFSATRPNEVEVQAGKEIADRFRRVGANTQRQLKTLYPIEKKLGKLASTRVPELEQRTEGEPTDAGNRAAYSKFQIARETELMDRFGKPDLSPEAQEIVDLHSQATKQIRKQAHEANMHLSNLRTPEGELVQIAESTGREVLTRQPTPRLADALLNGGPLREMFVDIAAHENGKTKEEVEKILEETGWSGGAQGLKKTNAIEMVRQLRMLPDFGVDAKGNTVRFFESNPLRHMKRMIREAAMRIGTVQEFGEDKRLGPEARKEAYESGLPTPYVSVVESVKGQKARETVAQALRASMGMATSRPSIDPSNPAYDFVQTVYALADVAAGAKMTFSSPLQNLAEPIGTATAMLGGERVAKGMGEVYSTLAGERSLERLVDEAIEAGGFQPHVPEHILGGETTKLENLQTGARAATNASMIPFEFTQTLQDLGIHKAVRLAVDEMRAGEGKVSDIPMLKNLFGFSTAEAEAMIRGEAPAEAYDRVQLTGLSLLTRRGDLPLDKSAFASHRDLTRLVRFTGYFQRQAETLRRSVVQMRDAETPEAAANAALSFMKMTGLNMAAYMAGQSLVKLTQGWDEFLQFWRESIDSPFKTTAAAMVGSLLGGAGATIGGAVHAMLMGDDKEKADALDQATSLVLPVKEAIDLVRFGDAMVRRSIGMPVGGVYSGKSPLQQIGYFVGQQVPGVKAVENGLFGLGMTYLGTDPGLDNALKASYRYDDRVVGSDAFDENDDKLFVDTMRKAVIGLREKGGGDANAIEQAIREALPGYDDKRIADSFLARRQLSGKNWEKLTQEQKAQKLKVLGESKVELLHGYDAALDSAAARFTPIKRRRR